MFLIVLLFVIVIHFVCCVLIVTFVIPVFYVDTFVIVLSLPRFPILVFLLCCNGASCFLTSNVAFALLQLLLWWLVLFIRSCCYCQYVTLFIVGSVRCYF